MIKNISLKVDINLDEPQKWKFEKGYGNSLLIKTSNEPSFYLASNCDGKVFTSQLKGHRSILGNISCK